MTSYKVDLSRMVTPEKACMIELQRYGLLHEEGQIFSSIFAEFVRGQQ